MLVISRVFCIFCFVAWFFATSFWIFLLGFFFLTVAGTLASGTLQSYVYDFLKLNGLEEEFEKIWGRGSGLLLIGIAIGVFFGGFLSVVSYELVVGLSALSPVVTAGIALMLPRMERSATTREKSYLRLIRSGVRQTFTRPVILRAFFYSAFVTVGPAALEEYDQVLLSSWLGLPNSSIGVWLAVGVGAGGIGAFYAHKVRKISWWILHIFAAIACLILFAVPFISSLWVVGILILLNMMGGSMGVLIQGIIQREIDTAERATITSVNETGMEVAAIALGLAFAFIADAFGIQIGYAFFGLVLAIYLIGYFVIRPAVKLGRRR